MFHRNRSFLMTLRAVFSALALLLSTGATFSAEAQHVYYRRPALCRVVVLRPAPRPVVVAPAPVVVLPARPAAYAPAPVVVRPRPVVVVRPRRAGYYRY